MLSAVMAVGRITMKSLAKFGFCLMILLTSVAGEWFIISGLIFILFFSERGEMNVLLMNI